MSKISPERIWVVCVTYGDRTAYIERMIQSASLQGIRNFVFWCNGLEDSIQSKLRQLARLKEAECNVAIEYIFKEQNFGPAIGYAGLLQHVLGISEEPDFVLFLDDDNVLGDGCVDALLDACHQNAAICAVRSDRSYLVRAAQTGEVNAAQAGEAFGVDFRNVFKRAWRKARKMILGRTDPRHRNNSTPVPIRRVPYGGLMVPYSLLQRVSGPREEFIIYADDYDYSERLADAGGLFLVPNAVVHDQEASWNASSETAKKSSNLRRLATSTPDFRIYYALRNALILDIERVSGRHSMLLSVNLALLKAGVFFYAVILRRKENYLTIRDAIRDARKKSLGLNAEYPLPK